MSVPLSTIKSALKIDYDDDDADLIRLREAATQLIENRTQIAIDRKVARLYLSSFTDILIPEFPYESISSIAYTDEAGDLATLDIANFRVDLTDGPIPVLRFIDPPSIYPNTSITVTYNVGYTSIPSPLTHAIIALTGAWYNNPEAFQPIGLTTVPMSVEFIISAYSTGSRIR
jgi:uncharacterized phiE125 gp8 family phage protein